MFFVVSDLHKEPIIIYILKIPYTVNGYGLSTIKRNVLIKYKNSCLSNIVIYGFLFYIFLRKTPNLFGGFLVIHIGVIGKLPLVCLYKDVVETPSLAGFPNIFSTKYFSQSF